MPIIHQEKDGCDAPLVVCDVCSKRIKDAHFAIVVWSEDGKSLAFLHKGECAEACGRDQGFPCWSGLDEFFHDIQHNAGYKPRKVRNRIRMREETGI